MKTFLPLCLLIFTFGCATRNITYDRNKILKKYTSTYKIYVDREKVDFETIYLDKDVIKNVQVDKKMKEVKIIQWKPTKLLELKNLNLDSTSTKQTHGNINENSLIIINGVPLTNSLNMKTKIDPNAIKSLRVLSQADVNKLAFCEGYNRNVIVITIK